MLCAHIKKINKHSSIKTSAVLIKSVQATVPPSLQSLRPLFLFGHSVGSLDAIELGISRIVSESIGSRRGSQVQLWFGMLQQLQERRRRVKGEGGVKLCGHVRDSNREFVRMKVKEEEEDGIRQQMRGSRMYQCS